ncbi:TA system VapC family ribonuclease toxin [Isoptericola sp. G70]|uniref:TA system VapC family ribonuclease toxin n=1 Tax=Isoptericola sp. G70 TaxID=3376633 RepID=UPI003A812858
MTDRVCLPDVNVLFAAHVAAHVHHATALSWLRGVPAFATCATTEQGLVRLLSNAAANPGASTADALAALARVRARRQHQFWRDDTSLAEPAVDLSRMVGHRQVTDFHLLNVAADRRGALVTFDAKIEHALSPSDRRHVVTLAG